MMCHSAPAAAFTVAELANGGERVLVTLRPHWFGWFAAEGYFCMSDPAAYSADRAGVSADGFGVFDAVRCGMCTRRCCRVLEEIWVERGKRLKGNWGRPVQLPTPKWAG